MDNRIARQSGDLYREILRKLRSRTDWELDDELTTVEDEIAALAAGEKGLGELYFSHPAVGARLSVRFPVLSTGEAVELLLDKPLDTHLEYSEDGFVGQLIDTQQAIAKRHETAYLEPIADPSLLARVRIPFEYDDEALAAALDGLELIAVDVEELHSDLIAVIDTRVE